VTPNEVTSADGGWGVLFAFVAKWAAAAEFMRWAEGQLRRSDRFRVRASNMNEGML
jgi:hypothetical protein